MYLKRILRSSASKNAAASYFSFISTSLWGLISIPVAVTYLDKTEIGLWAVVNAVLGYLGWMDLGIGPATGRLMAEAVAKNDQQEMNRWWCNTQVVLCTQGAIVVALGLLLTPLIILTLDVPLDMAQDARILIIGGVTMVGLTIPIRGIPGILTAQNRYHWVPLIHAIGPWIQLLVFFVLLRSGQGLISYIWAFATSRIALWTAFKLTIAMGPHRFKWDTSGLTKERYRKLFSFCGNIAILGLIESFIRTLPNMLIARLSGLAAIPAYNFSAKGPMLGSELVSQCSQSFYPGLQRLYVIGNRNKFRKKYYHIGMITMSVATIGAATVLVINRYMVQMLSANDFYAGPYVNVWFAATLITIPLAGFYKMLLPISGTMGKSSPVALGKAVISIGAGITGWNLFGMVGLAAVFALLPLVDGFYAYYRGTRNCGLAHHQLSSSVAVYGLICLSLTLLCGYISATNQMTAFNLHLMKWNFEIPSIRSIVLPILMAIVGVGIGQHHLIKLLK